MTLFSWNTLTRIRYTKTHLAVIIQRIRKDDRSFGGKFQSIGHEIIEYLHDPVLVGINHDLRQTFVKTQFYCSIMFLM